MRSYIVNGKLEVELQNAVDAVVEAIEFEDEETEAMDESTKWCSVYEVLSTMNVGDTVYLFACDVEVTRVEDVTDW